MFILIKMKYLKKICLYLEVPDKDFNQINWETYLEKKQLSVSKKGILSLNRIMRVLLKLKKIINSKENGQFQ